jgi:hypothetical protein
LQKRYGPDGLVVAYRSFKDVADLQNAGLTVAVLKFNALQDHCVPVLGVSTNGVLVGDPLTGLAWMPAADFEDKWEFVGLVLKRSDQGNSRP